MQVITLVELLRKWLRLKWVKTKNFDTVQKVYNKKIKKHNNKSIKHK